MILPMRGFGKGDPGEGKAPEGTRKDRRTPRASPVRRLNSSFANRCSAAASELVKIFFQEKLLVFAIVLRLDSFWAVFQDIGRLTVEVTADGFQCGKENSFCLSSFKNGQVLRGYLHGGR